MRWCPSGWASYYASPKLLKVKDLLRAIWCYRPARVRLARERGQVVRLDHPWRARTDVSSLDITSTEHAQGHLADADDLGCSLQRDLAALGPLAVAICCNVPVFAEPVHTLLGPGLARRHLRASPVQQARDLPVGHQPGELAHERYQIVGHGIVAAATRVQLDAQLQG